MVTNSGPQVPPRNLGELGCGACEHVFVCVCAKTLTYQPCVVVPLTVPLSARWALSSTQQLLGIMNGLCHNITLSQEASRVKGRERKETLDKVKRDTFIPLRLVMHK